jgi:NADH-quinone oxidoreductase subunit L
MGSALLLVVLLPALGALINGTRAFAHPHAPKNKSITNIVALGATALSALVATIFVVLPFRAHHAGSALQFSCYEWIPTGLGAVGQQIANFSIDLAFRVDPLSCTMLMIVTWIGFLIHVYATGYMSHETGYTRFFTYLNLFMFMMLLLVLGANYIVMFVGWEGVGLCSYLLIGFYYQKHEAADAGKKAFITNRIGDFGFILGIFLIFNTFGSADYGKVFALAAAGGHAQYGAIATAICLLLFVGACGKSAQVPLYVWLPDAMAGPTPVSALIHAATMVTAGVYMVVRSNVLFRLAPNAMLVVAIIGAVTAIFAASIALVQNDIKKVLAYSTVSQLGYMFVGAGVGAFTAAIFHVMTHAFFKACLFLGAGSVIHGCGGEQDMRKMGGLRKFMPRTHLTMLIATIAIAGIPPLAGFFSKDEILANAFGHHRLIWILGVITAGMTAFYMFRLYYMTFSGSYRGAHAEPAGRDAHAADRHGSAHGDAHGHGDDHGHGHASHDPHESPVSMTGVLAILALLAIVGGWVGWPAAIGGSHPTLFQRWLAPVLLPIDGHAFHFHEASHATEWILMAVSIGVALLGWFFARRFYRLDPHFATPKRLATKFSFAHRVLENKWYVDELYSKTVIAGTLMLCRALWWFDQWVVDGLVNGVRHLTVFVLGHGSSIFDKYVVDGAVNGVAWSAKGGSMMLRRMQSGLVQNYALIMGGGIVLIAMVYLFMKP